MKIEIVVSNLNVDHFAKLGDRSNENVLIYNTTDSLVEQNMKELIRKAVDNDLFGLLCEAKIRIDCDLNIVGAGKLVWNNSNPELKE